MKTLALACAAALLAGCVINTELPPNWKSVQRYGTGSHLTVTGSQDVKYSGSDEVKEMQRDRSGSRERAVPR